MMKNRLVCIPLTAVFVFLLAGCAVCQEQKVENFLSNGSFEVVNEQGFPVDWRFGSQPDDKDVPNMQGFIDMEIKREGRQSLRIVARGVTAIGERQR